MVRLREDRIIQVCIDVCLCAFIYIVVAQWHTYNTKDKIPSRSRFATGANFRKNKLILKTLGKRF